MKYALFHEWMKSLAHLSRKQRLELRASVTMTTRRDETTLRLEEGATPQCNCCGSARHYRWGRQAGLQRYRCRACQQTPTRCYLARH